MSTTPVRVGFMPTRRMIRPWSAASAPATRKNAAEEMSPGTSTCAASRRVTWLTDTRPSTVRTGTPNAASMRSVWSRVIACSITLVVPCAYRPASRIADLTCALATFRSCSQPISARPPCRCTGGWPSVVSIAAPISRSGRAARSIGRRDSDSSPTSTDSNDWPASRPIDSRIAVPALPMSSAWRGAFRPCSPAPWIRTRPSARRSIATPIARIALRVDRQSALARKPSTSVTPSAMPPSIIARWEIDLSPGTRSSPCTVRCGRTR